MRIVSLLPSATEMLCLIGLRDQLVGMTHECDYPATVNSLPKVTRTLIPADASSAEIDAIVRTRMQDKRALYSLDVATLERLRPNVVVTQSLCDVCAVAQDEVNRAIRSLAENPHVINLEPNTLEEVLECMLTIGSVLGIPEQARRVIDELRARVDAVGQRAARSARRPRVMLLEWMDPPFCAGHWNPTLVDMAGGREVLGTAGKRSMAVDWKDVLEVDPEILVIACCGFTSARAKKDLPILESNPGWSSLSCVRENQVHIVDGSAYFNRPGPRLVDSLEILAELISKWHVEAAIP